MANSRKSAKKSAPVAQMPTPPVTTSVEDVPQEFHEPSELKPEVASAPTKNPLKKKAPVLPSDGDFFARVAAVPQSDWDSQRVYLYLYVLEPLCNLKQQGGKAYFNRYSAPIRDEHQIAVECGSGRYRLMLAYNRVSADDSSEMARYEFEIYNPQYPPKVPRAAWINDPRNSKWEALLPKEAAATATGSVVEAMRMVSDIRRDLREEMAEPEPSGTSTNEVLQTMKYAKELFAPNGNGTAHNGTPVPADPFDTAKKIMDMRGNDPMIAALMQRLDAADKAAEKARDREFELMKELRQQSTAPASKGLADQLLELAALGDKLEPIKKLFGFGNGEAVGRAARTTAYDMARDIAASPFGANLGQGLGILLTNLASASAQQPNPAQQPRPPIVLNQQQNNGTAPPTESLEQRIQRIGQIITQPMIYEFFLKEQPGEIFAQQMFDMWPEDYIFMKSLGADDIVRRYHSFGPAWAVLAPKEPAFVEFIQEFCSWDPNQDEESQEPEASAVTDLEAE